jgi:hypothetical protein
MYVQSLPSSAISRLLTHAHFPREQGALAARAFCHAHVFPHLKLKEAVSTKVQELGDEARAQLAALSRSAAAASPRAAAAAQAQAQAASAPPPPPVVESPAAAKMHGELP